LGKEIFVFSGLGADERVFESIQFPGHSVFHIKWIQPNPDESIDSYAKRLIEQITSPNPILVGLSFGGMMAVEVAKLVNAERVILISSAKSSKEIPFYFRWAGALRLHKVIPASLLKSANFVSYWFFGVEKEREKTMLKSILADTDPIFLSWAIDKIVTWKHMGPNQKGLEHIHGDRDRILPIQLVQNPVEIKGGGHLMTLDKHEEINRWLAEILKEN
jgi:pimeloyl-ACP methyl ester carboxylesterase